MAGYDGFFGMGYMDTLFTRFCFSGRYGSDNAIRNVYRFDETDSQWMSQYTCVYFARERAMVFPVTKFRVGLFILLSFRLEWVMERSMAARQLARLLVVLSLLI